MDLHFFVSFGTRTVQLKEGEAFPWSLSCKKVHLGNWHTFLIGHVPLYVVFSGLLKKGELDSL